MVLDTFVSTVVIDLEVQHTPILTYSPWTSLFCWSGGHTRTHLALILLLRLSGPTFTLGIWKPVDKCFSPSLLKTDCWLHSPFISSPWRYAQRWRNPLAVKLNKTLLYISSPCPCFLGITVFQSSRCTSAWLHILLCSRTSLTQQYPKSILGKRRKGEKQNYMMKM